MSAFGEEEEDTNPNILAGYGASSGRNGVVAYKSHDRSNWPAEWPSEQKFDSIQCDKGVKRNGDKLREGVIKALQLELHTIKFSDSSWWTEAFGTPVMDPQLLIEIMKQKSYFDDKNLEEFYQARDRANPYENCKKDIFINRAAVKLMNIDHLFKLTSSLRKDAGAGQLVCADVCAGPGGFTEYMFWRMGPERLLQFGMTLKGKHDFNLKNFHVRTYTLHHNRPENRFLRIYGPDRFSDGSVFVRENVMKLHSSIYSLGAAYEELKGVRSVDMLTCDGGDDVSHNYNMQEIESKRLVLCQAIVALTIVRKGGHFVLKIFDSFSPFTVSVLYILYTQFETFTIIKPYSSRPANSERYVVCQNRVQYPAREALMEHLWKAADAQGEVRVPTSHIAEFEDVASLVDPEVIKKDGDFLKYLRDTNDAIGKAQLQALQDIQSCMEDPDLVLRMPGLEERCIETWRAGGVDQSREMVTSEAFVEDRHPEGGKPQSLWFSGPKDERDAKAVRSRREWGVVPFIVQIKGILSKAAVRRKAAPVRGKLG
ncbi:FtsJ-like methyltransferase [Carpediemonas membranifera]|uniref:Cap-specific mRNA (nucleoside-2'-O-)-methyltransferase 1 n=1 Tax=Carpediemonas membranifera TaxID=201153 RepID=A0A8J6B4D7_9EUKA|nr:FtsJ-like methyltransferase [Carpediemonas membranifera]|eukprot:KAG9389787.1 FtsJ-like methyltransferase [Carpediemonas membranifera]